MKKDPDELIDIPNYDETSDFLTPATRRDLRVGARLDAEEVGLLLRVFNYTYGNPKATFEPKRTDTSSLKRLMEAGFVEEVVNLKSPHWAQKTARKEFRVTEKGALRLLDPEALVTLMVMSL